MNTAWCIYGKRRHKSVLGIENQEGTPNYDFSRVKGELSSFGFLMLSMASYGNNDIKATLSLVAVFKWDLL